MEEKIRALNEKKIKQAEDQLAYAKIVAWILAVILLLSGSSMATNWFAYERTVEKIVEEPYEHVVDTVLTYVCYTTTYGDCYHAKGCQYLWNSSHITTVYEAKQKGYRDCSRCTPMERTTLELTETRYRDVTKEVTETIEPTLWVYVLGYAGIILLYVGFTKLTKKKIQDAKNSLETSNKDWRSQLIDPVIPPEELINTLCEQHNLCKMCGYKLDGSEFCRRCGAKIEK